MVPLDVVIRGVDALGDYFDEAFDNSVETDIEECRVVGFGSWESETEKYTGDVHLQVVCTLTTRG